MNLKHGHTANGQRTPEYKIWCSMNTRCNDSSNSLYGGRGITVHPEWQESFEAFFEHIGPRPSVAHSLDRIDNARGYEPGNVRWATRTEQMRNTRQNVWLTANGRTQCLSEWAAEVGMSVQRIKQRLSLGWSTEDALFRIGDGRAKLSVAEVLTILGCASRGEQPKDLAMRFGVSERTVYGIVKRKKWKSVDERRSA